MLYRFRLLYITLATAFLLIACGSEPSQDASSQQDTAENAQVAESEEMAETKTVMEIKVVEDTAASDTTSEAVEVEEASEGAATETAPETTQPVESVVEEAVEKPVPETFGETVDPLTQSAIERIVTQKGYNKEDYRFLVNETEEYIEVEVREKKKADISPMVGKYRYVFEDEEILTMDYLTGEFISMQEEE